MCVNIYIYIYIYIYNQIYIIYTPFTSAIFWYVFFAPLRFSSDFISLTQVFKFCLSVPELLASCCCCCFAVFKLIFLIKILFFFVTVKLAEKFL